MSTPKTINADLLHPIITLLSALSRSSYINCLDEDGDGSFDRSITDGQRDAIKKVLKALGYEDDEES